MGEVSEGCVGRLEGVPRPRDEALELWLLAGRRCAAFVGAVVEFGASPKRLRQAYFPSTGRRLPKPSAVRRRGQPEWLRPTTQQHQQRPRTASPSRRSKCTPPSSPPLPEPGRSGYAFGPQRLDKHLQASLTHPPPRLARARHLHSCSPWVRWAFRGGATANTEVFQHGRRCASSAKEGWI